MRFMNPSAPTRLSATSFERLVPIAEEVEAFTRSSGRAFVEQDGALARELLAHGGERQRIESELDAAWSEMLSVPPGPAESMTASVGLMVSLRGIADLAAAICDSVADMSTRAQRPSQPAMDRLAEMVPVMVQGAVSAMREGTSSSAEAVLKQGVSADVAFAQTYHEVMQMVRQNTANYDLAKQLHDISRNFERIGDGATEIADSVRAAALS
jgi:phosphate transport system protein